MPKFEVKLSFETMTAAGVRKKTAVQRFTARTEGEAVEAALENLHEEHGSDIWDAEVVSVKKLTPQTTQKTAPKRKKLFDGVQYSRWSSGHTEIDARNIARALREEGYKVRVTQEAGQGYVIWRRH